MGLHEDLAIVKGIARDAGAILMDIYATDFEVAYKSKANPVTEADTKANAFIVAKLREAFPADGIVAEESADRSDATGEGRCWYVDPLDGTKEFIAKNGEFAVMIGLAVDGEARLGVVYQPAKDKLYAGVVGAGATLKTKGSTISLNVSDVADPSKLTLVVSRSHRAEAVDRVVEALGVEHEMKSGSVGLKVGLIAERAADLYVHISDKSCAWDACGPEAILRAAGGRFTRLDGRLYRYAGEDVSNDGGILACNAAAYDAVFPAAYRVAREVGLVS